jgi:hypothetical protein
VIDKIIKINGVECVVYEDGSIYPMQRINDLFTDGQIEKIRQAIELDHKEISV